MAALDIEVLRTTMVHAVVAASGYDDQHVILLDQNTTRPLLPFIGIKITDLRSVGYDALGDVTEELGQSVTGIREFTTNVQAFGPQSWNALQNLLTALQTEAVVEALRAEAVTVYDTSDMKDVSWLDNSQYKERHTVDLFCRTGSHIFDSSVGTIGSIEATGTLTHFDNDPAPITIPLEVSE